jgi:ParB/RepB/Spo0J family partition protein
MTVLQTSAEKKTRAPAPAKPPPAAIDEKVQSLLPTERIPCVLRRNQLKPCPSNPRTHFGEGQLRTLADGIAQVGILQRLVVRPIPAKGQTPACESGAWSGVAHFEIICGHRRWHAAGIAKLDLIPVDVVEASDGLVELVQLIENEARADLSYSETVYAYAKLAKTHTPERIARTMGRPLSVVRATLRAGRLPAEVFNAVDDNKLPRVTAEIVARISGDHARAMAAACVLSGIRYPGRDKTPPKPGKDATPLTTRETKELIGRFFQKELKSAPFSRTALDLVEAAGSCDACPKRAGNDAEARADGVRADMCLDPDCYQAKLDAHTAKSLAAARADGRALIPKRDSAALFATWNNRLNTGTAYVDLADDCYEDPKHRGYRSLLKGLDARQVVIAVDHAGELHELVPKAVAVEHLKTHHKISRAGRCCSAGSAREKKDQAERDRKAKARKAAALEANRAVAARVQQHFKNTLTAESAAGLPLLLRPLATAVVDIAWSDAARHVARRRGLPGDPKDALKALAGELVDPAELLALVAEMVAARKSEGWGSHWYSGHLDAEDKAFWKAFGCDPAALWKQAEAGKLAKPEAGVRALAPAGPAKGEPILPLGLVHSELNRALAEKLLAGQKGMTQDKPVRIPHLAIGGRPHVVLYAEDGHDGAGRRTGGRTWIVRPLVAPGVAAGQGVAPSHSDPLECLRVEVRDKAAGSWYELVIGAKGSQRTLVHTPPARGSKA